MNIRFPFHRALADLFIVALLERLLILRHEFQKSGWDGALRMHAAILANCLAGDTDSAHARKLPLTSRSVIARAVHEYCRLRELCCV